MTPYAKYSRVNIVLVLLFCCSCFAAFNIFKGTVTTSEYFSSCLRGSDAVNEVAIPDHTITKLSAQEEKNSLAYSQSYGFFDDITDDHWKLLQKRAVEHNNHKYPEDVLTKDSQSWYANVSSEMAPSHCMYCISKLHCLSIALF